MVAVRRRAVDIKTQCGIGRAAPMSEALISRSKLVAECVIAPEVTALLEVARRNGSHVHTGIPMLFAQINMMLKFMGVE
jgi:shikimate dehydrogenase